MDSSRFDRLTKACASAHTRRKVLKSLLGLGAIGTAGKLLSDQTDAARRGYSGPTFPLPTWEGSGSGGVETPPPTADPCNGKPSCAQGGCCDGACTIDGDCCPSGHYLCGGEDCCESVLQCCGGACCPGGMYCFGGGLCCTFERLCSANRQNTCCPADSYCSEHGCMPL